MKEFNLEAAKNGAPVQTRNGKSARIICWDWKEIGNFPIIALVDEGDSETPYSYTERGHVFSSGDDNNDLVMALTKHERWVNVYREIDTGREYTGMVFLTEAEAKDNVEWKENWLYVTTTKIEWEE